VGRIVVWMFFWVGNYRAVRKAIQLVNQIIRDFIEMPTLLLIVSYKLQRTTNNPL